MIKLIKYPYARLEMEGVFEHLADFEKQQREWLKDADKISAVYWGALRYYVLDEMYNCSWYEYKPANIGDIFYDAHEAQEVYEFCDWFYTLIQAIGRGKPDSAYLDYPEWSKIIEGAKGIYELIQQNNEKYDYGACLDLFNNTPPEDRRNVFNWSS